MKKEVPIRTIVAIGIGAAVFVILGRFAAIPTGVANTTLQLTYPFLALMGILFGPLAGGLIGLIGHALTDATAYGSPWWSWVICSGIMGVIFGFIGKRIRLESGQFNVKAMIYFCLTQAVASIVVWGFIAPTLDILIYSESARKVYLQGATSSIANLLITAVVGTILLKAYAASQVKKGSLHIEDDEK